MSILIGIVLIILGLAIMIISHKHENQYDKPKLNEYIYILFAYIAMFLIVVGGLFIFCKQ